MADTIRQIIIQAIYNTLSNATFTVLNGATVYQGVTAFDEQNDPLPLITIVPQVEDSIQTCGRIVTNSMLLTILGIAAMNDSNPMILGEQILGELIAETFKTDFTGLVEIVDMRYSGGGVDQYPDDFDIPFLTANMSVMIDYEVELGDPYNQLTN